ncbi:MAG: SDR family NAD(P)-dependent oxidoreductase [Syntrophales bacterium]
MYSADIQKELSYNMTRFSDTVTFITGASSGIGAALALEVARQGGDVALVARREERLQKLVREIESMGRQALAVPCDVSRDDDLQAAAGKTIDQFGRINYVVANAGFGVGGRFEKLTIDDYRRQFETNVFGVLKTVYATREHLAASHGCLVIIGSINGYIATPRLSAYSMSKFALHGLAESLRHEFRRQGIGVVLIVPGYVQTEIRQVDKLGVHHPEMKDRIPAWMRISRAEAASQMARAMYSRERERIITGHGKIAVFLQRHCPRLMSVIISRMGAKGLV